MEKNTLSNIASIDLESNEKQVIYSIGAVIDTNVDTVAKSVINAEPTSAKTNEFSKKGRFNLQQALFELDSFVQYATFLLGHNLLIHDLPVLAQQAPGLNYIPNL